MRKLWDKIVAWLQGITADKRMHFWAGFAIAAFFCIALGMSFWCFVPAFFAGIIKEFFDDWTTGQMDWKDFFATCIGGALPALFKVQNLLIF